VDVVRVTEVQGAIPVGPAHGLDQQVDPQCLVLAVAVVLHCQDIQDLANGHAAGGGWRRGDDVRAAILEHERAALDHGVPGEILQGPDTASGLDAVHHPFCSLARIEAGEPLLRQAPQGLCKIRLPDQFPLCRQLAVAQEDPGGIGAGAQGAQTKARHLLEGGVHRKALFREPDGRCQTRIQGQSTIPAGEMHQRSRRAGNGRGEGTVQRRPGDELAVRVQVQAPVRSPGRRLPGVKHHRAPWLRLMQQEEAAAAQSRSLWLGDAQGRGHGDRHIEGIAAGREDLLTRGGGQRMRTGHRMLAGSGLRGDADGQQPQDAEDRARRARAPAQG
jgi:hypothetical protein